VARFYQKVTNVKNRHQLTLRLKPSEVRALDRLAKRQEISRAELVRQIIDKAMEKYGKARR
jgi:predicted HicB family RNase H-like nuclease